MSERYAVTTIDELAAPASPGQAQWHNLACAHARAGRPDVAVAYPEEAVELDPRFAELARDDEDLASVRGRL